MNEIDGSGFARCVTTQPRMLSRPPSGVPAAQLLCEALHCTTCLPACLGVDPRRRHAPAGTSARASAAPWACPMHPNPARLGAVHAAAAIHQRQPHSTVPRIVIVLRVVRTCQHPHIPACMQPPRTSASPSTVPRMIFSCCVSCAYASISVALSVAVPAMMRPMLMPAASPATCSPMGWAVVAGCGWMWLVVAGCGLLWLVVVGCGC